MSSVQAGACVLSLALAERGELEQRHGSLTCGIYSEQKVTVLYLTQT